MSRSARQVPEMTAYVPAHRVKSHDQHDIVRHSRYLPAGIQKTARPGAVAREPSSGGVTGDPDTAKCASPRPGKARPSRAFLT
jgi:hypothetical protein